MNNRILRTAGIAAAGIFMLVSCSDFSNMQIPETVSVKTDATYSANFGSFSKSLSDYISVDTIKEQIAKSSTSFSVYDYNPDSDAAIQHFLIKYPAMDKSIDISDQLNSINIGTSLDSSIGFNQSFTVPEINQTFSETTEQNLYSTIYSKSSLNGSGTIIVLDTGDSKTHTPAELGYELTPISITVSGIQFDTISYRSGKLDIAITPQTNPPGDFKFILKAMLYKSDGTTEIASSSETDVSQGGTLSIPLTTNPLVPSMMLKFSGSITSSTSVSSYSYAVTAGLSSDAQMSEITGLTMSSSELESAGSLSFSQTVSAGTVSDSFISAKIEEGNIIVQAVLPDGWTGVTADSSFAVSGGLSSPNQFNDVTGSGSLINKSLSLEGATFTPQDITITGNASLTLSNATIIFPSSGTVDITTSGSCKVTKFTSATINLGDDVQTSYTYETAVPDELKDFVTKIDYSKIGVSFNYINGLPTNTANDINNISVKAVSTFMNMTGTDESLSKTLTAGTTTKTSTELVSQDSFINLTTYSADDSKIDITIDVTLPGATPEHPTYVTVSNIEPGSSYSLSMSDFALVFDWSAITINSSALTQSATDVDTGLNFSTLLAGVTESMSADQAAEVKKLYNMTFNAIPVYLYISKPVVLEGGNDIFENLKAKGTISLTAKMSDEVNPEEPIVLIDKQGTSDTDYIDFPQSVPSLSEDSSGTVISNLDTLAGEGALTAVTSADLPGILTSKLESLKMTYTVSMSDEGGTGLTISKSAVDSLKESGGALTISAVVYIDLPLDLTTSDKISVNVMKLADKSSTDDLLGRSSALDTSDYQKYLDAIKNITLGISAGNTMGLSGAGITITDNDKIFGKEGKILYLSGDSTISLTGSQITTLLKTTPYMPTITLTIPKQTELKIPRNADFSIGIKASIATDGTIQLYGGNN
jgi:hypothetical protein